VHHATPLLGTALLLAAHAVSAQGIWRCGNSYSAQPCAGATPVEAHPAPTAADAAQARRAAEADARRAEALEKARLEREKSAPRAIVIGPLEKEQPAEGKKKEGKPPKKPGDFTAMGPKPAAKGKTK
jgi:hypothetical protein